MGGHELHHKHSTGQAEKASAKSQLNAYADSGDRGTLIKDSIVSFTKMKHVLDERLARRASQGKSPIKYSPYQGQGRIILAISQNESTTQAELARKLDIRPQTLSTALKKLEASSLIEREADPLDARVLRVKLSERGKELNQSLLAEEKYSGSMFEALDNEELAVLIGACRKLTAHLSAEIEANEAVLSLLSNEADER